MITQASYSYIYKMAYHVMLAKQRQDDRNQEHLTTPSHSGRWDGGQENVAESPETPGWQSHEQHTRHFWSGVINHHKKSYKVSAGDGMSISQVIQDTSAKQRMEEFESQKKLKG